MPKPDLTQMKYEESVKNYVAYSEDFWVTDTSARFSGLEAGKYLIICQQDAFIMQGDSTVVATSNDYWIAQNYEEYFCVTDSTNNAMAVIREDTNGSATIQKLMDT